MSSEDQIEKSMFNAIARLNELLPEDQAVPHASDTMLLGSGAHLDSMGFINFVVTLEEELAANAGIVISLVEELNNMPTGGHSPTTIGDFISFLRDWAAKRSA